MTTDERWLPAMWSFVADQLPPAPAKVLELGCGPVGGFVPMLLERGYDAVGVDPRAPDGLAYRQIEFEDFSVPTPVDAVVASTSLHHVVDLDRALDLVAAALAPGGTVVVVEWAWEEFDEATAQWSFARLGPDERWLHRHRERWMAAKLSWEEYLRAFADEHGLHEGGRVVEGLDARFARERCEKGPYVFCDAAEQDAIDKGEITALGIRYRGSLRS